MIESLLQILEFWFNPSLLGSTLRMSTPILLACLAGLFCERSGIVDIGLEGKLLVGAFASAATAAVTGSAMMGLFVGVLFSILFSFLHGFASITLRGNQLISGVAINFLAAGLTAFFGRSWFGQGGNTPALKGDARFSTLDQILHQFVPNFADGLAQLPLIGTFYSKTLAGNTMLVYVALLAVPLTAWIVYKTRFGLRLLAVGENPAAVDTAGISVARLRYTALLIAGILVGLGGVYLSNGMQASFGPGMSAGRGYLALAALIFAKWKPWNALGSCLFFGYLYAFSIRYASFEFPIMLSITSIMLIFTFVNLFTGKRGWGGNLILGLASSVLVVSVTGLILLISGLGLDAHTIFPTQLMDALPYILTMIVLAGFIGKAIAPRAIGTPYEKEH